MVKIFIDPGHGGSDVGAVGHGLQEKNLTLDIAKRIQNYLNNHFTGHRIRLSRTTDSTLSLTQRTNMANTWSANLFLSIHINAGGGSGYEDFIYNGLSNTSVTARLRDTFHAENVRGQSFWRNRGKKKANFAVLRQSQMSAILTENGFIDTKADADKLKSDMYLNLIAKGHAEGVAKVFNLTRIEEGQVVEQNQDPSPTHKEAWDKAVTKGILNGQNPHRPVTREQLATILDRLGLLD